MTKLQYNFGAGLVKQKAAILLPTAISWLTTQQSRVFLRWGQVVKQQNDGQYLTPVAAMTMVSMGVSPRCPVNIKDKISMPEVYTYTASLSGNGYLSQTALIHHLSQKLGLITCD